MAAPDYCPHCGTEVPPRARSCPQCGSDEKTGWSDNAGAERLGLPDEDFDYEEYTRREFGPASPKPRGLSWFWWGVAVVILAIWLFSYFR